VWHPMQHDAGQTWVPGMGAGWGPLGLDPHLPSLSPAAGSGAESATHPAVIHHLDFIGPTGPAWCQLSRRCASQ
jgi:hypothetical protein